MTNAGAHGIPHAFVVDKAGTITYSGHPADPKFEQALQASTESQAPPPPRAEKQALPLVTESYEELMKMSAKVSQLLRVCDDRLVLYRDARQNSLAVPRGPCQTAMRIGTLFIVKELKLILSDRSIDTKGCLEKGDFAQLIVSSCSNVTYYK